MLGCDNKDLKKPSLGGSRGEESCSAVVQLLERVSGLQRELEQRQSQEEAEQVQSSQLLLRSSPACYDILVQVASSSQSHIDTGATADTGEHPNRVPLSGKTRFHWVRIILLPESPAQDS